MSGYIGSVAQLRISYPQELGSSGKTCSVQWSSHDNAGHS